MTSQETKNTKPETQPEVSTPSGNGFDFEQWAREVKRQMIATLSSNDSRSR